MRSALILSTFLSLLACQEPGETLKKEATNEGKREASDTSGKAKTVIITDESNLSSPKRISSSGKYMTIVAGIENYLELVTKDKDTRVWLAWTENDTTKIKLRINQIGGSEVVYFPNDPNFYHNFSPVDSCSFYLGPPDGEVNYYFKIEDKNCPHSYNHETSPAYDPVVK